MDRAERTGFGIALAAHAALFAALSLNLLRPPELPKIESDPIEVSLVDKVALEATAPEPVAAAPASAAQEVQPEPEQATPPPVVQPRQAVKPLEKAKPAVAKPEKSPPRKPGLSCDLVSHLVDTPDARGSAGTPAKAIGPAVA